MLIKPSFQGRSEAINQRIGVDPHITSSSFLRFRFRRGPDPQYVGRRIVQRSSGRGNEASATAAVLWRKCECDGRARDSSDYDGSAR